MAGGRNPDVEREYRAEVAKFLKQVTSDAGYRTQAEIAKDIHVEPSRVSHWLNETGEGRGPSAFNVLQVIRAAAVRRAQTGASMDAVASSDPLPESFEGQVAMLSSLMRETIRLLREAQLTKNATRQSRRRATGTA